MTDSILSDKVARALQMRTDTPAMKAALEALSLDDMDARSVRVAMEHDALQQAQRLQSRLKTLVTELEQVRSGVDQVAKLAHQVKSSINRDVILQSQNNESSESQLEREQRLASTLSEAFVQRNAARQRLQAVQEFMDKFDLSPQDGRLLDTFSFADIDLNSNNNLDKATSFLQALDRVRHIRQALSDRQSDSRLGPTSALRMMETLAQQQERAYERLYQWLQSFLQLNNANNNAVSINPDALDEALQHSFVQRALQTLRHVPAFYAHLLELVAASRRSEITKRFLLALTSGYQGQPPIEIKAHDSVAYIGDMLAFSFTALVGEVDLVKGLLVVEGDEENKESEETAENTSDDLYNISEHTMTACDLLATAISGLSRPLKSRIIQVIATLARRPDEDEVESDDGNLMFADSQDEDENSALRLAHLYNICGLLLFYISACKKDIQKVTIKDIDDNPLVKALADCLIDATNAFEAAIRVYGATLSQQAGGECALAHALIERLANVRSQSPGFVSDVECPENCRVILTMDWPIQVVIEQAALDKIQSLDDVVLLKTAVNSASSATKIKELHDKITSVESKLLAELVETKVDYVLDACGLSSIHSKWRSNPTLSSISLPDLKDALQDFYASLYSPPLPQLDIKDATLRKRANSEICKSVCDFYQELYDAATAESNEYAEIMTHTPDNVRTLFSS